MKKFTDPGVLVITIHHISCHGEIKAFPHFSYSPLPAGIFFLLPQTQLGFSNIKLSFSTHKYYNNHELKLKASESPYPETEASEPSCPYSGHFLEIAERSYVVLWFTVYKCLHGAAPGILQRCLKVSWKRVTHTHSPF